jgi:hypothetical protein
MTYREAASGQPLVVPNALLVIAHPDDESMFFGPLLRARSLEYRWHILCLSTGTGIFNDNVVKALIPLRFPLSTDVTPVMQVMQTDLDLHDVVSSGQRQVFCRYAKNTNLPAERCVTRL